MNVDNDWKKRLSRMRLWRESNEYKSLCSKRRIDCERLVSVGKEYLQFIRNNGTALLGTAANIEYAVDGNIHRGVYCPSPVLDIIMGNVRRGRILKRVTARSKISHRFGFDAQNNLIYTETFDNGEISSIEYLFIRDDCRIGITINSNYDLESITEEVFENRKIVRYSLLSVYPDHNDYFCANLYIETYTYDVYGLTSCDKEEFQPYINTLHMCHYDFSRENGYLSTFTVKNHPIQETDEEQYVFPEYTVTIKRKV